MNSTCAVLYVVVIFISFAGRSIEDASCCTCTSPSLPQLLNKPSEQMQQLLQFSLSRSRGVAGKIGGYFFYYFPPTEPKRAPIHRLMLKLFSANERNEDTDLGCVVFPSFRKS